VSALITVTPAVLTVTANNFVVAYGAADPAYTAAITGLVNGDSLATAVTGTPALSSTATITSPVGSYPITAAGGTLAAKNYSFVYVAGTLTVTQASGYTVSWKPATVVYGASTVGSGTLVATSSIAGSFSYSPALGTVLGVGTTTVTATFTPTDSVDYSSQTVSALITVTPAVLTVTANNFVVAYGAADPAYTAAITGLVNGDSLATAVTGTPALSSTATITSPVGSYPITAAGGTLAAKNYSFVYVAGTLTVTQASGYTVSWKPATVVYGASTVGSGTLVATSSIAGSFSYSPAAGTVLGVGTTTVTATFTPTDSVDYSSQTVSALITVTPAVLTVTANNFVVAYGAADPAYTAAITGLVNGDSLATAVTGTPALSSTATITSPVGSYPITAAGGTLAAKNYSFVYVAGTLTVTQASGYTVSWKPATVVYGASTVGSGTLVATSSIAGSFSYSPALGTVLGVGTTTVTATFTPTDSVDYSSQTVSALITVTPAVLTVTANNFNRAYNTANPTFAGGISGAVNGDTFTESFSTTATLTSAAGTYPITPTVSGLNLANYTIVATPGTLTVTQASAIISWSSATVTYGSSTVGSGALVATSSIAGSFSYSPAAGTVLGVGTTTVTATFTPTDSKDYSSQTASAVITVTPATLTLTANSFNRAYNTANPTFTGNISGAVNGDTFTEIFSTIASLTSATGTYPITPSVTGANLSNYTVVATPGTLTVTQASATISWNPAPASIVYGTALGSGQLDASSNGIAGSFSYSPSPGTVLGVGATTVTATFTPTDSKDYSSQTASAVITVTPATLTLTANSFNRAYNTANPTFTGNISGAVNGDTFTEIFSTIASLTSATGTYPITPSVTGANLSNYTVVATPGTLTVTQASPTISWNPAPASIVYGTALGGGQLDASSNGIAGSFSYSPSPGTVLGAGSQTLSVTFNPADATDYSSQTVTATITVTPATLTVSASNATRIYNTPNPTFFGTIVGSTNGDNFSESFSTVATTTSVVGSYLIVPSVTGANLNDYTVVYENGTLIIGQATPVITWNTPSLIIYGTPLSSSSQLNATASVPGTFIYSPAAGSIPAAGTDTLSVTFTPADTVDYTSVSKTVNLTVAQATPVIVWPTPANIVYGTALSSAQLDASAYQANGTTPLAGVYAYTPQVGAELSVGSQELSVTFTPTDTQDFTSTTKTVSLTVTDAVLTVEANNFTRLYGTVNPVFTGSVTGQRDGDTFTETFATTASILSPVAQYSIIPTASGTDLGDYMEVVQNGTLSIVKAPVITTTTVSTAAIAFGLPVTMSTSVISTTSGTPTGTVSYFDNGNLLGTATLVNGVASLSTSTLSVGSHVILALYSGDGNFLATTASANSGTSTVLITPLDFTIQVTSATTVDGTYGTTRQFTLHLAPVGGSYPGDVSLASSGTGPIDSLYSFSPDTISMYGGPADVTFTVKSRTLAVSEAPVGLTRKLAPIAFGFLLLPFLGMRYSRRTGRKLGRIISNTILILISLGAIGSLSGCGAGYFDHVYPIQITAVSNGIQHSVVVDFHIEKSAQ
jgi:hypothetical protein